MRKKALGRGLNSLIPDSYSVVAGGADNRGVLLAEKALLSIAVDKIVPCSEQPRKFFDEDKLDELVASVKEKGILQPLIVREAGDGKYALICGERRYRSAVKAGLQEVPVVVKDVSSSDVLELALIENIQREDLSPVEEAQAYLRLYERGYSHEDIATKVGKNRTTIVNSIRLLKLPKEILSFIEAKKLSEGHARALLSLVSKDEQIALTKRIIAEDLSVRQLEEIVRNRGYKKRAAKKLRKIDSQILDLERKIEEKIGSKVRIFAGKRKGRIEIKYFSLDDLDRILNLLGVDYK